MEAAHGGNCLLYHTVSLQLSKCHWSEIFNLFPWILNPFSSPLDENICMHLYLDNYYLATWILPPFQILGCFSLHRYFTIYVLRKEALLYAYMPLMIIPVMLAKCFWFFSFDRPWLFVSYHSTPRTIRACWSRHVDENLLLISVLRHIIVFYV